MDVYKSLGYIDAEFVTDEKGVVTGDILYVRETIHAVKDVEKIANGTEKTLTTKLLCVIVTILTLTMKNIIQIRTSL